MTKEMDSDWFEDRIDREGTDGSVGIGVRDATKKEWLPSDQIRSEPNGEATDARQFVLDVGAGREETRYYPQFESDSPSVVRRYRYFLPIAEVRDAGGGSSTNQEIHLVLETPFQIDLTEFGGDEERVVFAEEILGRIGEGNGFEPIRVNRVAGLNEQKETLTRFLTSSNESWGLTDETGIVLEGPPGTGKTELVMEVCQEQFGRMPVMISGPEILSKWVGESERLLRQKFEEARDSTHRVLYIDELDAIARSRSEASEDYNAQIVAQLLVLLDGVEAKRDQASRPLKVIASTNLSHVVDSALRRPGRLGSRPIRFDRPDRSARQAILHHYLEQVSAHADPENGLGPELKRFVSGDDETGIYETVESEIIEEMDGFTGADIEDVVQAAISDLQEGGESELSLGVLQRVLGSEFSPSHDYSTVEFSSEDIVSGLDEDVNIDSDTVVVGLPRGASHGNQLAETVARSRFDRLCAGIPSSEEEDHRFILRTVGPSDLLDGDAMRTVENVVEVFQTAENETVCVYVRDFDRLRRARNQSGTVQRLFGALTDQLLQWDDGNLLIVDAPGDDLATAVPVPVQPIEL